MATSGSVDFTVTRDELITDALLDIGGASLGNTPTADQIAHAARKLNMMIKSLQKDRIYLNAIDTQTVNTVASTATITLAAGTKRVIRAWLRIDNNDYPLDIYDMNAYDAIVSKATENQPQALFVAYDNDVPTATLYPVPEAVYAVHYRRERLLEDMDATANNFDFPVKALQMLLKGLRYELAPSYGVPLQERMTLKSEYDEERIAYLSGDTQRYGDEIVRPPFVV